MDWERSLGPADDRKNFRPVLREGLTIAAAAGLSTALITVISPADPLLWLVSAGFVTMAGLTLALAKRLRRDLRGPAHYASSKTRLSVLDRAARRVSTSLDV
ncbi:hypothetical protein JM93_01010 [Roseibium hamelinense]|uniref:Uncharacterized protein n=1 Tax=Roseibium hamelinense TaxID=150831 RepID=A0A562TAA9_9HYPH|nr:hypothetical protein [Roseibium hamelinense]MTI45588.1 hypothetical protein [Roseibium hamelinense]TWI90034.1 hypothetical protein JM93_01010 [Roseibium hamelinense]